ncbi:MAG: UDP-2,3-diacylglucosamine diphosphatase [Verrucomicrobiota bacterium]
MKRVTLKFKTIILSDVHLGTRDCKIDEVNFFLKHSHSDRLILNGDIIDGWSLSRKGGWTKQHTRFIRLILKKLEKKDTEVVYLRGNHDDILYRFLPLEFDRLHIVNEFIHSTPRGDYLVVHGDGFDSITTNHKWIAILGAVGYQTLLRINRIYNKFRSWRGKPYYSLSKQIKAKVKGAVSFVDKFEDKLRDLARSKNCCGVICGHIHTAADKFVEEIHYLNSGDWVESRTVLVEHFDGSFEIFDFNEFERRLEEKAIRNEKDNRGSEEVELPPVEEDPVWENEAFLNGTPSPQR